MLFFCFWILDLYLLVAAVIAQTFDPIAELVIPIGMPSEETRAEIEIHPVTAKAKIRMCSI